MVEASVVRSAVTVASGKLKRQKAVAESNEVLSSTRTRMRFKFGESFARTLCVFGVKTRLKRSSWQTEGFIAIREARSQLSK